MKPLRHIAEFLELAAVHAPTRAAARAAWEGNHSTPLRTTLPWGNHGWIFKVWSLKRTPWIVCVEVLEEERRYKVTWVKR